MSQIKWNVVLGNRIIDDVFYDPQLDAEYVRTTLISHDGMDNAIEVYRDADLPTSLISQTKPVRPLLCACCGKQTRGRQFPSQDYGYGICPECADWITGNSISQPCTNPQMEHTYGIRGIHYDIKE